MKFDFIAVGQGAGYIIKGFLDGFENLLLAEVVFAANPDNEVAFGQSHNIRLSEA
jgi:hypothetical protein